MPNPFEWNSAAGGQNALFRKKWLRDTQAAGVPFHVSAALGEELRRMHGEVTEVARAAAELREQYTKAPPRQLKAGHHWDPLEAALADGPCPMTLELIELLQSEYGEEVVPDMEQLAKTLSFVLRHRFDHELKRFRREVDAQDASMAKGLQMRRAFFRSQLEHLPNIGEVLSTRSERIFTALGMHLLRVSAQDFAAHTALRLSVRADTPIADAPRARDTHRRRADAPTPIRTLSLSLPSTRR